MIRKLGSYTVINIIFMAIIMAIIFYSLIFVSNHPIPALLTDTTGIIPPSKGLSRAFSMIVRGKIDAALQLNPHSIRIFMFFALQLLIRIVAIFLSNKTKIKESTLIKVDIMISILLLAFCFAPLIKYTAMLFNNMRF